MEGARGSDTTYQYLSFGHGTTHLSILTGASRCSIENPGDESESVMNQNGAIFVRFEEKKHFEMV